jgi:hypothetical protein
MGQQASSLQPINYDTDPYYQKLIKHYSSKSLTPLLMRYIREKHKNVCKTSLHQRAFIGTTLDSFIFFSMGTDFAFTVRGDEEEILESMEEDGYYLAYPSKEEVYKNGFEGALLVRKNFIDTFTKCVEECKDKSTCFYYFDCTIALPLTSSQHATAVIYNSFTKRFEFYDSEGQDPWTFGKNSEELQYNFGSNLTRLNTAMTVAIRNINKTLEQKGYIDVKKPLETLEETCPKFGVQSIEGKYSDKFKKTFSTPLEGYCGVWTLITLDTRLSNPDLTPLEVSRLLLKTPPGIDAGGYLRQKVHKFLMDAYNWLITH